MAIESIITKELVKSISELSKNIPETAAKEIPKDKVENIKSSVDGVLMKLNDIKNLTSEKLKMQAEENIYKKLEIEKSAIIKNKEDGLRREEEVGKYLKEKYPKEDGYTTESEVYLRDENGNIIKDEKTGESRRIDYVVIKDGKVVDSIEVTSKTADKTEQLAKEERIRGQGGNYVKDSNGNLVAIPEEVKTRIERRD